MLYSPELVVSHERRPTWAAFAAQIFKYGRGRGQLIARRPRATRLAWVVPSVFLIYLLVIPFALPAVRRPILFAPLLIYMAVVAAGAAWIGWTLRRFGAVPASALLITTVHAAYGAGVAAGMAEGASAGEAPEFAHFPARLRLLWVLVLRQLRLLRKRSWVGVVWPLAAPLMLLAVYAFVFGGIFHLPAPRYAEFLFAGLLPWTFLTQTLGSAVTSLSSEGEMIRRARFPYELIPVATVTTMSLYFLVTLAGYITYLAFEGHVRLVLLPIIAIPVASLYLLVGALALIFALVDVYNRDLRQVLSTLLTIWFFLVPVVYPQQVLGSHLTFLRSIDPVNIIVGQFRDVLYLGHVQSPRHVVQVLIASALLYLAARATFRRLAPRLPLNVR
jgi:ABC-type polysaccharide/polyol phosphate export permease